MERRKFRLWHAVLLAFLLAGTVYIARQRRPAEFQHDEGIIFGTFYSATYQHPSSLKAGIEEVLGRVDAEFSMFNDSSTVSRINRGEQPVLSPEFEEMLRLAERVRTQTDGAFDISVAPLVNAWGFGFKHEALPSEEQVDSLLRLRDQMDFSAIAKGHGADRVASLLADDYGIENFMIEIGGEIVSRGQSPSGKDWRIGISRPTEDALSQDGPLHAVISLSSACLATSGNYRNFYYKDGRRYAHTIDPRTGYPVEQSILSATVLAPSCAEADAFATAFMVEGIERSKEILSLHPELRAYLIYRVGDDSTAVFQSEGLQVISAK